MYCCPCSLQQHKRASVEPAEREKDFERLRAEKDRENYEAAKEVEKLQCELEAAIQVSVYDGLPACQNLF
jgi:hypothetical protein